ncbi:MAG: 3-oxoacyl-[acyl-carrier-protein] reductase [Deltaproteobacteria bacterium]|nr:MAG: 3-oxoacyl-[acyl-carrier-protein] reductase [Deltaproteobacteria bacterium]
MSSALAGKLALVTGASRGIGAAIARDLAAAGGRVVVNYRERRDAAEAVAADIRAAGGFAEVLGFDVADGDAVDAAIRDVAARLGNVDILVNNAGVSADGLILRTSDEAWDRVLDVNLKGVFNCTKAVSRAMMRARSGRIVNISSVVGFMGNTGQSTYAAAKAGVIGFTKAAARELASRDITVNAVAPGLIATDMLEGMQAAARDMVLALVPLGRSGTPEEVAAAVTFLAGPGGAYITGQVIHVNGGLYV